MTAIMEPRISFEIRDTRYIQRGNIWLADMSLALGSEQSGVRPVLVISNNVGNRYSPTIEVCCITTQTKTKIPTHVELPIIDFLPRKSMIMTEQKRTIDKMRLITFMGSLDEDMMERVNNALRISLGL